MGFKRTLYKRYSFFFIISVIVISVVVIKIQRDIFLENLKDKAETVTSILSAISLDAIITYDYVTMERYINDVSKKGDLKGIRVVRSDGEILAESGFGEKVKNTILIKYPLNLANNHIGDIELVFSKENIDRVTVYIIVYTVLFVLFVHLAGLFINNRIINKLIISPIDKIIEATKGIENKNYNINISLKNEDEFKMLAKALNDMSKKIQSNISELIDKQLIIEEEKGKIEAILNSIADGVFVTDNEEKIIAFTKSAEEITGYSFQEVKGKYCEEIFKSNLCSQTCALRNINNTIRNKEAKLITKDNKQISVIVSSAIIYGKDNQIIGGVQTFRDITEEKQKQIMYAHTEMLAAIGQMAAAVAHETNNPLANVIGYTKILLQNKNIDDFTREKLEIILEQALKASTKVKEMLTYSKRPIVKHTYVNINSIIDKVIKFLDVNIKKKNILVYLNYSTNVNIYADESQIEQVFFNIISNSIYAVTDNGMIEISTRTTEKYFEIVIKDNGIGIRKENIKNIFSPFYTTKPAGEGTGLGLFVSMKIIKEHNGFIDVESEPGKYTKFIIRLPIVGQNENLNC